MAGTRFGRYLLQRPLGDGVTGQVWSAHDTATDRTVAVKVLPAYLTADPVFEERFRRESHAAAALREPHVLPIHGHGEIEGRLYLDMQLIDGTALTALLARDGPLPPGRAVSIVEQVAAALDAAHAARLVHRDVTPAGILVCPNDFAYLTGFGIARAAGEPVMTGTGVPVGTLAYTAPERFTTGQADPRTDVYALTCVLHECLTGAPPYPGETFEQQSIAHLTAPPPRPSLARPGIPAGFDEVIARGMAKNPDDRYPTCAALTAAARDALEPADPRSAPAPTRPEAATTVRRPTVPTEPDETAQQQTETWARAGRPDSAPPLLGPPIGGRPPEHSPHAGRPAPWWRRPAALIVGVAVVALGAVGYTLWRGQDTDDRAVQNPAMVFDGMYDAEYRVQATHGAAYRGESAYTARWAVRTHCPAATGPCVTSVTTTGPDDPPGTPPTQFVMDYRDGTWSAVRELPATECQVTSTGAPLQDVPTWDSRTLTLDGPQPDGHSLTGTRVEYRGDPCARRTETGITLRRTGEVDPAIPLTPPTEIAPIGPTSPGAALTGTYNLISTPAVVPPGGTPAPQNLTGRFRTHCLRTGDRCASILITDATPEGYMYLYANGQWVWAYTGAPRSCFPDKPDDPRTTFADHRDTLNRTGAGEGPAQKLAGRRVSALHGDCTGIYEYTVDVTRTGD
ncbi:MAG: hypothetical protein EOP24_45315 [Hyphomicrobiales bacterium]|nr:MAG: hypothetical protein EOP24_45315 [Hyphomicrobiales bacterium]